MVENKQKVNTFKGLKWKERREKLLRIFNGLGTSKINIADLARKFGVTRKTIYKDIDEIAKDIRKIPPEQIVLDNEVHDEWIRIKLTPLLTSENENIVLGALKLRHQVKKDEVDTKQRCGLIAMPVQPHTFTDQLSYEEVKRVYEQSKAKRRKDKSHRKKSN